MRSLPWLISRLVAITLIVVAVSGAMIALFLWIYMLAYLTDQAIMYLGF